MKIIFSGRQTGKTTKLIQMSAETGYTIVCLNGNMANVVKRQAVKMGLEIPAPIRLDIFIDNLEMYHRADKGYLIDDANGLINTLLSRYAQQKPIGAIVLNDNNDKIEGV